MPPKARATIELPHPWTDVRQEDRRCGDHGEGAGIEKIIRNIERVKGLDRGRRAVSMPL